MTGLAALLSLVLGAASLLHLAWVLGLCWPARDEAALARAVYGAPGPDRMPPRAATGTVALALGTAALWPWMILREPGWLTATVASLLVAVLAMRGAATYVGIIAAMSPKEPFVTYDRRYYAPLVLALAAGFAALIYAEMR